ncbi:hypothetical protein GUITHDRAFT_102615 [Guillardia theta CCMP2712]|uniref:Uncharacterized protein n=1 Tax=Guillardia theta (strain CCMP2712) TaxID=905079 RepID=L1JUW5_GUITC|nr:hypothetical protein GUITHDRAFT_102615 [Guillardia theta CCMP2712]EKX52000.1 hypothetical protein GUITHDRAFT_102615 [Guillardia theta CCMP2712]|eukprot:XP_005838980.1 hypothetical protein GUITHDRAFT_102615 [Guillardia theta CCMP2712]
MTSTATSNTVVPFEEPVDATKGKPDVFRVDFSNYMSTQDLIAEIDKKQLIDPKTHTRATDFVNGVVKDEKIQDVAGPKGMGVLKTASFPHDYAEERIKRATGTQMTAYQVHQHFASPQFVAIDKIIKENKETILHMFPTIAYIGFPSNNQTMTGPGLIILTNKRVYMYCHEDRTAASGSENMFGTTCWPRLLCCCIPGGCAFCPCCKVNNGEYVHVATRETEDIFAVVGIEDILPNSFSFDRAESTKLQRKFRFCCYHGYSSFKYDFGFHDFKRVEPYVIREFTKGDDSEWSLEELQELEEALMILESGLEHTWRDGSKTKGDTPDAWKHMCQSKREELKKGFRTYQNCRVAAYRGINFKYLDRAKNKALTTTAIVDHSVCNVEELCKFTISANSMENLAKDVKMLKNSMNGYENNGSSLVRDAVLDTPSLGSLLASPGQLAKLAKKYLVCCNEDYCFEFCCGKLMLACPRCRPLCWCWF